ncbi:MAG: glycerophosphoryl diester phosphodiesterase membrane domain-containing protein [Microbacterium sp.]
MNAFRARRRARFLADRETLALAIRNMRAQLPAYVIAILATQGLSIGVVLPAVRWLFSLALSAAGIDNVTDRTLGAFIVHPLAVLIVVAIVVIVFTYVFAQFALLIAIASRQHAHARVTFPGVMRDVGVSFRAASHPSLPLLGLYLVVVLPASGLGIEPAVTSWISIPPFVTREYLKDPMSTLVYTGMVGGLVIVSCLLIYTMPLIDAGHVHPARAMWLSIRAAIRRPVHVTAVLAVPTATSILLSSGFNEAFLGFLGIDPDGPGRTLRIGIIIGRTLGMVVLTVSLVVAVNVLVIESRMLLVARGMDLQVAEDPVLLRARDLLAAAVSIVLVAGVSYAGATVSISPQTTTPSASPSSTAEPFDAVILGHRGDVWGGVENTISGLEAAAEDDVDYVEADFQLTKDGVWVASHDANLLVLAGVNKNISDMTAAEVTSTVVSSHGHSDTIPTMAEYVTRAQELGITLLLEIKNTTDTPADYVPSFFAVLDELGVTEDEIYHCLDPDTVIEMKRERPELRIGLTIALSVGGVPDGPWDFFVVEQASFTRDFLEQAHAEDKDVYVWTVNDSDRMLELLNMGVDGIVTDFSAEAVRLRNGGPEAGG